MKPDKGPVHLPGVPENEVIRTGDIGGNPLVTIVGFLNSVEGKAFLEAIKGVLDNFSGVFGASGADSDEAQRGQRTYGSFLAFTFFYTVAIYVLLIGFHYVQAARTP